MDLEISQRERDGIPILDLCGKLVMGDTESLLRGTVAALSQKGSVNVILNLAKLNEIDEDGLATLIYCHAVLRKAGGALKLLNLSKVHTELFISLKLGSLFEIFQDEQDAVSTFFPDRAAERPWDILEFVEHQEKRNK